jgi:DNA-binding HxlR family transcriptional regulator
MRDYGQYCPIARTSEILAERWMPLIVRNLLLGCTTFTEIHEGTPGISRSLLSKRLRELEQVGVIAIRPKHDGHGCSYELTAAGRDLWKVMLAMRTWGGRWLEMTPVHTGPDVVLWAWCTFCLRRDRLPQGRIVVRFTFADQPTPRQRLWMLIEHGAAEVCNKPPGVEEDLVVAVQDSRTLARWYLGQLEWGDALRAGDIVVTGPRELARALPGWNRRDSIVGGPELDGMDQARPAARQAATPLGSASTAVPGFNGRLLTPADDAYEPARLLWNGAIDRRPAYIAVCRDPDDVVAALRFARERELPVGDEAAARGSRGPDGHRGRRGGLEGAGHGHAGLWACDHGRDGLQHGDRGVDAGRGDRLADATTRADRGQPAVGRGRHG